MADPPKIRSRKVKNMFICLFMLYGEKRHQRSDGILINYKINVCGLVTSSTRTEEVKSTVVALVKIH